MTRYDGHPEPHEVGLSLRRESGDCGARTSAAQVSSLPPSYQLGELVVIEATAPRAPAAPVVKTEPAPKSTAAPSPKLAVSPAMHTAGMQMLDEGFGVASEAGVALELDNEALTTRSAHATKKAKAKARPKPVHQGLVATLFGPVAWSKAGPYAAAFIGMMMAFGMAGYLVKDSDYLALALGLPTAAQQAANDRDRQPDDPESADAAPSDRAQYPRPTHSLLRVLPRPMVAPVAALLRSRVKGATKIPIDWPRGASRPAGIVECILLDRAYAFNLPKLLSTGYRISPAPEVLAQIEDRIGTSEDDEQARPIAICLAN